MTTLVGSDYQVLQDAELRLDDGESQQLRFKVSNAFFYSSAMRNHGLLAFSIRPADTGRLTATAIGAGPATVMSQRLFTKSHTRMHQEAFDLDAIVTATNTSIGEPIGRLLIEFGVEDGPLILSDVVIHYKIGIPVN